MDKTNVTGTIRLDCAPGVLGALGSAFWNGLAWRHPQLYVTHRQARDTQVDTSLTRGECDLALLAAPYPRDASVYELYCCPVCLWVPATSPLAEKRLFIIEDLAEKTIAVPGSSAKCRDRLERLAEERGVKLGGIVDVTDTTATYGFAASGAGLGFTVRHLRGHPAFANNRCVRAVPLEGASWSFGIGHAAGHVLSQAEQAFWDWCVDYAAGLPRDRFCNKNLLGVCTRMP